MENLFDNTKVAFSLKSDTELDRAYYLFQLINIPSLVKIGTTVTNFAIKAHLPVEGLIRATVFDHFCGGISEDDCLVVVDKMFDKGVTSILDYSVEGKEEEEQFDVALKTTLKIIQYATKRKAIPFAVFKPTGFGRFALYEKISAKQALTSAEENEWKKVIARFDIACNEANKNNVSILIDAEESWIQEAVDTVATYMMQKYNTQKVIVYNTLQMYRCDRLEFLKQQLTAAKKEGFFIGIKLVRGAYLEKEKIHTNKNGSPSPICNSKEATDKNYDDILLYMIDNLNQMSIFAGTHNESSCYKLIALMHQNNIAKNDNRIWFGQLYGMSDTISFNLGANGYNVAKYLPFGPVKEVMPYLIRRAEENTSIVGQTSRELQMIKEERKRRKEQG